MTNDQKIIAVLAKLKEIKLLACEIQTLMQCNDVRKEIENNLNANALSLYRNLEDLSDMLYNIPTRSEDGIQLCSNFEKQRRENYSKATHNANIARKEYYENEWNSGKVGRPTKRPIYYY